MAQFGAITTKAQSPQDICSFEAHDEARRASYCYFHQGRRQITRLEMPAIFLHAQYFGDDPSPFSALLRSIVEARSKCRPRRHYMAVDDMPSSALIRRMAKICSVNAIITRGLLLTSITSSSTIGQRFFDERRRRAESGRAPSAQRASRSQKESVRGGAHDWSFPMRLPDYFHVDDCL